jgi:hypothetical protein
MNSDLNRMNDILGVLNIKNNSCKNGTAAISSTIYYCMSHIIIFVT